MLTRRHLIGAAGAGLALSGSGLGLRSAAVAAGGLDLPAGLPQGVRDNAILDTLPGKKPLIKLSYRPPNYETPLQYFRTAITPNDAFFVRYHLAGIPEVHAKTWKLAVGGEGANSQAELTLDDLKAFPTVELAAVNLCSGNRRGLFQPHVPGVEWGYGAMGRARWKGARLKDILDKVGLKKEAIEVVFDGADTPISDKTPDFIKSIPAWKAIEDTTLVAYEMNGVPLPHLHGFPARLILPGWTGTYWMKHLDLGLGFDQAGNPVLDELGLSHPARPVSAGGALHVAGDGGQYADHRDRGELADHRTHRGRDGEAGRTGYHRRHRLGRRLRHPHGRGVERRRHDLGRGDAGRGYRALRLPHLQRQILPEGARQADGDGARHQQDRPDPDHRAHPQPRRLPPQPHSRRQFQRGLKGQTHARTHPCPRRQ